MTSRPKHVSSLSDKIAGLKFMQRAKAVQEKEQPASSPQEQPNGHSRDEATDASVAEGEEANEEHWVLPGTHAVKRSVTATSSSISHEPGWNAWLDAEAEGQNDESKPTTRRLFGAWVKKGRKHKESPKDAEEDDAWEPALEDELDSQDDGADNLDSGEESEPSSVESKGFIKPGTLVKPGKTKGRAGQKDGAAGRQRSTGGSGGADSKKRREWEGAASPGKSRSSKKKRTSKQ